MPDDGRHSAHDDEPSTPVGDTGIVVDETGPDIAGTRGRRAAI